MTEDKPKRKRTPRPEQTKKGLTPQEAEFVKNYGSPKSPTFLNATASYREAYPGNTQQSCQTNSSIKLRKPAIVETLKEMFDKPPIKAAIFAGMEKRLQDPFSRYFQPSAEFVARVTGDFAPEKHEVSTMKSEERDAFYLKVVEKIEKASNPPLLEEAPKEKSDDLS